MAAIAFSAALTCEVDPAVAMSALELSRYPDFEKSTTTFACGATPSEKVPLVAVIVVAPPADTVAPASTAPVESVTIPLTVVAVLAGPPDFELLHAANAKTTETTAADRSHARPEKGDIARS
jgi:hypothetical protein